MSEFVGFLGQNAGFWFKLFLFADIAVLLGLMIWGVWDAAEVMETELSEAWQAGRSARDRDLPDYGSPDWTLDKIEDHDDSTQDKIRDWTAGWRQRDQEIFRQSTVRMQAAGTIIALLCKYAERTDLKNLGQSIAICESQEGFPAEMSFTHLEQNTKLTPEEKAVVLFWYTAEAMKHRRNSALSSKRYRQLQLRNTELALDVIKTGKFSSIFHKLT